MLMGAAGGLLGALFNSLNVNLTKYRMKYLHRRSCCGFFRYMYMYIVYTCMYMIHVTEVYKYMKCTE